MFRENSNKTRGHFVFESFQDAGQDTSCGSENVQKHVSHVHELCLVSYRHRRSEEISGTGFDIGSVGRSDRHVWMRGDRYLR